MMIKQRSLRSHLRKGIFYKCHNIGKFVFIIFRHTLLLVIRLDKDNPKLYSHLDEHIKQLGIEMKKKVAKQWLLYKELVT